MAQKHIKSNIPRQFQVGFLAMLLALSCELSMPLLFLLLSIMSQLLGLTKVTNAFFLDMCR
jgi:hypothetical protein